LANSGTENIKETDVLALDQRVNSAWYS